MKKLIALLLLAVVMPSLIGCEAHVKADSDHDSVKVKGKVDTD
jgi:hypothetical protein